MSPNLLGEFSLQKEHALPDDQQSFLWIGLYYIILTFNPTRPKHMTTQGIIKGYFEECIYNPELGSYEGGSHKQNLIMGKSALTRLAVPNNKPMEQWYKRVLSVFSRVELAGFDPEPKFFNDEPPHEPPQHPPSELDRHDALEQIFKDALASEGWSLTRDTVSDEPNPLLHPRCTGSATTKRRATDPEPADDDNDSEKSLSSGSKSKRPEMSQSERPSKLESTQPETS